MVRHPRYQPIVVPDGPFHVRLRNIAEEARDLDALNSGFESLLADLKSEFAIAAVRAAIHAFRNQERASEQVYRRRR